MIHRNTHSVIRIFLGYNQLLWRYWRRWKWKFELFLFAIFHSTLTHIIYTCASKLKETVIILLNVLTKKQNKIYQKNILSNYSQFNFTSDHTLRIKFVYFPLLISSRKLQLSLSLWWLENMNKNSVINKKIPTHLNVCHNKLSPNTYIGIENYFKYIKHPYLHTYMRVCSYYNQLRSIRISICIM